MFLLCLNSFISCGTFFVIFFPCSLSFQGPPKLSTDKKNLSTRLVQRRLQHNEIIRKHKEKIKQQLKLQRELKASVAQQKKGLTLSYEDMSGQSTIFSSSTNTILPRPLSVQPYMCNSTSSKDSHNASIWCTSTSSDMKHLSGLQPQIIEPKLRTTCSPAQTKRCQSTSLVEKHLVSSYKLVEPLVDEHMGTNLTKKIGINDDGWSQADTQYQPCKQTLLLSTSDGTSRSPSISPITTAVIGCAARNISRLLESPAPSTVTVVHQNKRIGEDMSQEEAAFVKKRCTTSIGVVKQDSLDLTTCRKEDDFTILRPYSCPISFHDSTRCNKSKKKGAKSVKASLKMKSTDLLCTDKKNDSNQAEGGKEITQKIENMKDTKSYHFVQKPQVISRPETCVITSPSCLSNSNHTPQESTGRTRYNILNSLLSSDYDMMSAVNEPMAKTQNLTKSDQVPHLRRISCVSHTNNTDGCRSAFVPVTSQKQFTNSSTSTESTQMKLESDKECIKGNGISNQVFHSGFSSKNEEDKSVGFGGKNGNDSSSAMKLKEKSFLSNYLCTTASSSSSSSSSTLCQSGDSVVSVVDSAFTTPTPTTGNQKLATASAPATLSKVSSSSFAPAWLVSAAQSRNNGPDCISVTAGSPSFVPKKANKNRFTPIRPKLEGCLNVSPQKLRATSTSASPQKRDMRPVHTILQEHRVKNAQDLLANLAQNYQAELGLPTSCNVSSASVIVSFGPPKSESSQKSAPPRAASLSVLNSLPLQTLPFKETPRAVSSTSGTICQSQGSPAVSVSSLLSESQVILLPSSTHKQAVSEAQPILVQDTKGNKYAVDKQPAGTLLLQRDLIIQPREGQVVNTSNLLGLSTKQAHVVGPDAQGQTYLLVPNSEKKLPQKRSKSCVPVSVTSVETPVPLIQPSISLTSVLSSKPNVELHLDKTAGKDTGQIEIQNSAAPSAFHKCSPMGSTSKLSDKTPKLDLVDTSAKGNQQKDLESNSGTTDTDKLTTDAASLKGETKLMVVDQSKIGIDESSTVLMKNIAKNKMKEALNSSSLDLIVDDSPVDKNVSISVVTTEQISKDCVMTKVNEDLTNSQSFNKVTNTTVQPQQVFRKRKAATVNSFEHEGKKRTEEGENMENVEPPDPQRAIETEDDPTEKQKSSVHEEKSESPLSIMSFKTSPLSDTSVNQTDTETLLGMIGDTRSMTVKEVVIALNKLRAKLKDQGEKDTLKPVCGSRASIQDFCYEKQAMIPDEKDNDKKAKVLKNEVTSLTFCENSLGIKETQNTKTIPVTVSYPQRPSRRNISLNLESLEIDALLDLEPSLDSKLVGDIRERDVLKTGQQEERRASVGTAIKAQEPFHFDSKASLPNLMNMKHRSKSLKRLDSSSIASDLNKDSRPASVCVVDFKEKAETFGAKKPLSSLKCKRKNAEKTKSCVQDILERGVHCKRNDVAHHFSSVVGHLSRGQNPEHVQSSPSCKKDVNFYESDNQVKDYEQIKSSTEQLKFHGYTGEMKTNTDFDSDLPLDVIEFITESMSDDNSYCSNQLSHNPIASWLADFDGSTPSTEPVEETECEKSASSSVSTAKVLPTQLKGKLLCEIEDKATNISQVKRKDTSSQSNAQGENDCEQHTNVLSTRAVSTPCPDGTFLSPTGPARSIRRSSMERMVSGEKNFTRIPNEQQRPPSRLKSRAETPIESFCSTPSELIISGKSPVVKRDPFSVRDHTTALMLQQSVTPRLPSLAANELPPETCMTSFMRQGSAEICRADRALSETPVSDPGYSSVGQTPVSEVGGSSVSPSPVMMSLDSTFRPVKSELESNQVNTDNLSHPPESNVDSRNFATYQVLAPRVADQRVQHSEPIPLPSSTSTSKFSSQGDLSSGSNNENSSGISSLNDTLCALSELDHLMSVRLQCIPTPPSSPSGSPQLPKDTFNACLPDQKQTDKPYTSTSFIAPPCPPNSIPSASATTAPAMHRLNVTTNCPGLVTNPDFVNSGIISRFSPSPHLSVRPSCSPYQPYSHPSPPFTPSSQRCLTPSTIAMLSPRSNTPGTESTATPNRFMPIQTSGILATSMTVTQTYIQPIKPVVTLASAAVQKNLGSKGPNSLSRLPTVPLSTSTFTSTTSTHQNPTKINHLVASHLNSSVSRRLASKKAHQIHDNRPISWTSCSIPQKFQSSSKPAGSSSMEKMSQPALVLSLGGNMGSVSLSGQGMALFDHIQHSTVQGANLPTYQEAVSNMAGAEKQQTYSTGDVSQYHTVQGGLTVRRVAKPVNPASKILSQYTENIYDVPFTAGMSTQLSFADGGVSHSQSSPLAQQVSQRSMSAGIQGNATARKRWPRREASAGGAEICTSAFSMSHTPDDLEETLDVLKTLDSQYFQQEEDSSSSTSL